MSDVMTPVDRDDPRWVAWQYVKTPEFGNTRSWPVKDPSYIDGALWAAFLVGWDAALARAALAARIAPTDAMIDAAFRSMHGYCNDPGARGLTENRQRATVEAALRAALAARDRT